MKEKNRTTLRYLSNVSGKHKSNIVFLLLIQVFIGVSSVFYALFFRNVIDSASRQDTPAIYRAVAGLLILMILQIISGCLGRFLQENFSADMENAFRKRLFTTLLDSSYSQVTNVHTGEWMNRLTSDTSIVVSGMATILPGLTGLLARLCGAFALLLYIEPRFVCLFLPGGLILSLLSRVFRRYLKTLHKRVQEADGKVRVTLQEYLESLILIKTFGANRKSVDHVWDEMKRHKQERMKRNRFSIFCSAGFSGIMNAAYLLGIIYCAFGIYHKTLTYGTMMALLQLIGQIQAPFAGITGYLPKYYAMLASAERLMEAETFVRDRIPAYDASVSPHSPSGNWKKLVLTDVSFSYQSKDNGEIEVFKHLNLSIERGEFIALTGASGCGKSTLLKILMNLYLPACGQTTVLLQEEADSSRQAKTASLDASFRHLFAYVPQKNLLMSQSIRKIVTFAQFCHDKNEDDRIKNALKIACAAEFVEALPDGVDTILGERGAGLSEGQLQRICIARAVYADRPILLLDEATSALDETTEANVLKNLKELTDKTVLIVTHRPAALAVCDRNIRFPLTEDNR